MFKDWDPIRWDIREMTGIDLLRDTEGVTWHWFEDTLSAILSAPVTQYDPNGEALWRYRYQRVVRGK